MMMSCEQLAIVRCHSRGLPPQQPMDWRRHAANRRGSIEAGVRVAIGTDSLASVEDLNLFSEMWRVRSAVPDVPAGRILKSATLEGAVALGFGRELGSISPGKRAELLAVRVPRGRHAEDVEEYLVGRNRAG